MLTNLQKSLRFFVIALVAASTSSCLYIEDSGPPYGSYRHTPGSVYHSSAYGSPRPYYRNNYHYRDSHYGHYHNHHYRKDEDRIKLTAGQQRGKPNRPQGYHTREWYEKRGYDLDKYKHKHEDSGNYHEGSDYKKKSSSRNRERHCPMRASSRCSP